MNSERQEEASTKLYDTLPTATSIRVLKLVPNSGDDYTQLRCTLHLTDLEYDCLDFKCLSYTWGDPLFHPIYKKRSAAFARDVYVLCNDIQFKITDNLEAALRAISRQYSTNETFRNSTPYLWVDSLCINQADTQERNSQVGLMAQIYSTSSLVISWLGPADTDSDIAIPIIRQWVTRINSAQALDADGNDNSIAFAKSLTMDTLSIPESHYQSLARFYARQYFLRCWVLQEVVLARNLRIFCGFEEVQFEHLRQVATVITFIKKHRQEEPIGQALGLALIANRGYMHESVVTDFYRYREGVLLSKDGSGTSFFEFPQLLVLARFLGCSNPRDKIYAILGVVPPEALNVTPNYEKSVEEVYAEAIRYWIRDTKCVNILSWVADKSRRSSPSFPSWIGEFDILQSLSQQEISGMNILHFAAGSSRTSPAYLNPINFRLLTVRGKNIDQIVELAQPWTWHGLGVGFDPLWTSMTLKLPSTYSTGQTRGEALIRTVVAEEINGERMDSFSDMSALKAVVRRDTCFALNRQLHRMRWFSKFEISNPDYEKMALEILQELDTLAVADESGFIPSSEEVRAMQSATCYCKYNLTDVSFPSSPRTLSEYDQDRPPSSNPACLYMTELQQAALFNPDAPTPVRRSPDLHSTENWNTDFSGAVNHVMFSRRLARTQNGYLGLVPDSSRIGDAVWLLQGGSVPFILRPIIPEEKEGNGKQLERWELMGDAYVHGVMKGEVWNEIQENELVDIDLM